jgi:hypothetical protein
MLQKTCRCSARACPQAPPDPEFNADLVYCSSLDLTGLSGAQGTSLSKSIFASRATHTIGTRLTIDNLLYQADEKYTYQVIDDHLSLRLTLSSVLLFQMLLPDLMTRGS